MSVVFSVSIPRSGHTRLTVCLRHYFDENFRYLQFSRGHSFREMLDYDFVKTHDFGIRKNWPLKWYYEFPNDHKYKYLILIRNPILSSISDFYLSARDELKKVPTHDAWRNYATGAIDYRRRFIEKWLVRNNNPHSLILSYENFVNDPEGVLARVISHLRPEEKVEKDRLHEIVSSQNIINRRILADFEFYDEREIAGLIEKLGPVADFLNNKTDLGIELTG